MAVADLVVRRPQGLYCPPGDFYIDPLRPVPRAVIAHAHADHARAGHGQVLSTAVSEGVLRCRLGAGLKLQGLRYGEAVHHRGGPAHFCSPVGRTHQRCLPRGGRAPARDQGAGRAA